MKNNVLILGKASVNEYVDAIMQHCDPENLSILYTDLDQILLAGAAYKLGLESKYLSSSCEVEQEAISIVLIFSRGKDFDPDIIPHFTDREIPIVILPVK